MCLNIGTSKNYEFYIWEKERAQKLEVRTGFHPNVFKYWDT